MNFFKSAFGFNGNKMPARQEKNNMAVQDPINRRNFLVGAARLAAGATLLSMSDDLFAMTGEFQASSSQDVEAIRRILNGQTMAHKYADNKRIFNDPNILIQKYKEKDFEYYKPKHGERSKFRSVFMKGFPGKDYDRALIEAGFEIIPTPNDFVFNAEIEGGEAYDRDSFYANGLVIMEKGTKIARKKNPDGTWKNYIYDCLNPIYAGACPPKYK
jgi:hypothetical protein